MCGISGLGYAGAQSPAPETIRLMNDAMAHRGPDGDGVYLHGHVALGHRRLSLIDLAGGHQPMMNEDDSVVVVFNGEIYNYQELRTRLLERGHRFRTNSDTEVLVHLYEDHGVAMLGHLRGMFAFAIYDKHNEQLFLARDRYGIKPLYYAQANGCFAFASEIKPLLKAGISFEVNRRAIHLYLQSRFAHSDETIFQGIHRLSEGSYLLWKDGRITTARYYEYREGTIGGDGAATAERFEEIFSDAVRSHMVADVPVGAYLSGGVDSSIIVSEMRRHTSTRIRTFCVDFEHGYREADAAQQTARELDCDHETVVVGIDELLELPDVIRTLEEPVGDPIVVAQYCLSRATRRAGVKTVLTGDGADEILAGYQHVGALVKAARWSQALPSFLFTRVAAPLARHTPHWMMRRLTGMPMDVSVAARERLVLLLLQLPPQDPRALYDLLLSLYCPNELNGLYTDRFRQEMDRQPIEHFAGPASGRDLVQQIISMQFRKWLPSNINLKQDRLCMAHSVENRVPFLDHRLVEEVAAFPAQAKINGKRNKAALRDLASRRLPARVSEVRKVPFHLPIEHFLQDRRLRDLVEDNLDEARVVRRGLLRPEVVRHIKEKAHRGDYLTAKKMFSLVILELWFRTFVDREIQ